MKTVHVNKKKQFNWKNVNLDVNKQLSLMASIEILKET